jgi:hypothetical protein
LLRQSKTDKTREGVALALDIETTLAVTQWIDLARINDGYLLKRIVGNKPNQSMDPGQISRMFKSLADKAGLNPKKSVGIRHASVPLKTCWIAAQASDRSWRELGGARLTL